MEEKDNKKIEFDLEKKIMNEINTGKVKLRSRYIFVAEKLGLGSAFALSALLSVLFFSLILFYLRQSDNIGYLSFGNLGLTAFLDSFPYLLVMVVVVLIFIAGFILRKSEFAYKFSFGYLSLVLVSVVIAIGSVLTAARVDERIEHAAFSSQPVGYVVRPFLHRDLGDRRGGISGQVTDVEEDFIVVQTPYSERVVDISGLTYDASAELMPGQFVMIVGEREGESFIAHAIKIINEEELQMVRSALRQFGPRPNKNH